MPRFIQVISVFVLLFTLNLRTVHAQDFAYNDYVECAAFFYVYALVYDGSGDREKAETFAAGGSMIVDYTANKFPEKGSKQQIEEHAFTITSTTAQKLLKDENYADEYLNANTTRCLNIGEQVVNSQ